MGSRSMAVSQAITLPAISCAFSIVPWNWDGLWNPLSRSSGRPCGERKAMVGSELTS